MPLVPGENASAADIITKNAESFRDLAALGVRLAAISVVVGATDDAVVAFVVLIFSAVDWIGVGRFLCL